MEKITRFNKVQRGRHEVVYPFTTYPLIFEHEKMDNPLQSALCKYLSTVFVYGTPKKEYCSVSQGPLLDIKAERNGSNEVSKMCSETGYQGNGTKQHEIVQDYFMKNDPHTIAIEVPVYDDEFHGHIDIVRIYGNTIQVLDFKPNAGKEKKAASQVFRYRLLLSKHIFNILHSLGKPLDQTYKIEAGYFDEHAYYMITS